MGVVGRVLLKCDTVNLINQAADRTGYCEYGMNLGVVKDGERHDQLFDYEERSVLSGVNCRLSLFCASFISFIHSFHSLSYDRCIASSNVSSP